MEGFDFLYASIAGSVEMLTSFYFFVRFLQKKVQKMEMLLFALSGIAAVVFMVNIPITKIRKGSALSAVIFYGRNFYR